MAPARGRLRRPPSPAPPGGIAVPTRVLIIMALVTGLVILVAFAVQVMMANGS